MNYKKFYDDLITRGVSRTYLDGYTERHHIIPRCMGGSNDDSNLVKLTAREHFLAHLALAKIYDGTEFAHMMASAVSYMRCTGNSIHIKNRYFNSRLYQIVRKLCYKNSFSKLKRNIDKITFTKAERNLIYIDGERHEKLCDCGCGEFFLTNLITQTTKADHIGTILKYCKCGCGEQFRAPIYDKKLYIIDHNHTHKENLEKMGKKVSKSLTEYLKNLTSDEMSDRIKKSWGSCDQIARGEAISRGKKGKSTNQQKIVGLRYASMSDDEFKDFLSTKTSNQSIINRMINLRNKWKNIQLSPTLEN